MLYKKLFNYERFEIDITLGMFLSVWFNDYILGKLGQITNPTIKKGWPRTTS